MTRTLLAAASALLVAGCATYGSPGSQYPVGYPEPGYGPPPAAYPPAPPPTAKCPILRSGEWNAWVNMMPGPNARPTLHVTGKVVVPTGGYQMGFDPQLIIRKSYPAQAIARLRVAPPTGGASQAVMTHEVRWEWPLSQQVGSLEIVCEGETLARISQVPTAQ
ncbi:MAG TPA: hypothetical protein VMK31_00950 [Sphingomicrobium sp.]|nr:hypothetical protein [Sphingomicrobium sp.]